MENNNLLVSILVFSLSLLIRIYKINNPNFVLWDEAHFGKFSLKYLTRLFHFDVHPPFGKLLTSLFGYLSSQPHDFAFESATIYPEEFNYVFMRTLHAISSSLLPLLCNLTLYELEYNYIIRFLITAFLIFENGLVSISRLILLDSHLMSFTSLTVYCLCKYIKKRTFLNMLFLGISIGCVMSIKWIGCFTTLFVGLFIIWELIYLFCDSMNSLTKVVKQFLLRIVVLIFLPSAIYLFFFILHFYILENHSSEAIYVNSIFNLTLKKNGAENVNADLLKYVDFGHPVSIKSGLEYLHSHEHPYPNTSINQVTGYRHIDENNEWAFQKVTEDSDTEEYLESNMDIALLHLKTRRYLGVSPAPAVTKSETSDNEKRVDCRNKKLLEENIFKLEYVSDWNKTERKIKTISTSFRIKFQTDKSYYLKMTKNKYPSWGFNQMEVVFTNKKEDSSIWVVDNNYKKKNKPTNNFIYQELVKSKMLFFKFFKDLNISMFNVNKSFVQNVDEEPAKIVSSPIEWFIFKRGLRMGTWDKEANKFYMFINPLLWLLSSVSVCLAPLIFIYRVIQYKRKGQKISNLKMEAISVFVAFGGWLLHYLPFFYVTRVCYFHHYFPSLYFASLSIAYVFKDVRSVYLICLGGLYISVFFAYSPLTYGFKNLNEVRHLQLVDSWDFV
ncbi:Dolichyl-phosphate-mannose--protein mannosyltransferase 3 [Cucumispora dikerogammari]|nr:Dolichyl-phosphate-mannose--protein mannosyltransferase 3 [Cucumispora dikerogammari]